MRGTWWMLVWRYEVAWGISVITALLCVLLVTMTTTKRSSRQLPPGPFALPLIGHMHQLIGANPVHSLARMGLRYGPLISLKLGSIPLIVASTPEAARQILQTHDQTFQFRARLASAEAIYGSCPGITFADPGPYWRFLRQFCATDLFNLQRLKGFKSIRDEQVRMLLQSVVDSDTLESEGFLGHSQRVSDRDAHRSQASPIIQEAVPPPIGDSCILDKQPHNFQASTMEGSCDLNTNSTKPRISDSNSQASLRIATRLVHLRPKLQTTTNNIISRMAVGETSHIVLPPVLEAMEAMSGTNLGDFFPWIQWADLQGCVKRSKKAGIKMHEAFQNMIERRRNERGGKYEPPSDILDILLSASLTCPYDLQITDAHIRAVLLDILGAGTDTSAVVLEWTMAELLANTNKMKMVEDEIQSVLSTKEGNKDIVEEADIQNMPYLRAVVKESMRLHPVAPLLIPRESRKACKIFDFDIPAKTRVFVNTWAIGRDPKVWDNPSEFQPERFLDSNIDVHGRHYELLPFGSGRRVCPGQNLGLLNVHIILACLLHAFSWTPHDHDHDMSEKFGFLTTKATPLLARATPKLPTGFSSLA